RPPRARLPRASPWERTSRRTRGGGRGGSPRPRPRAGGGRARPQPEPWASHPGAELGCLELHPRRAPASAEALGRGALAGDQCIRAGSLLGEAAPPTPLLEPRRCYDRVVEVAEDVLEPSGSLRERARALADDRRSRLRRVADALRPDPDLVQVRVRRMLVE